MIGESSALYPAITPNACGHLDVGAGHAVYWETCGNPEGIPALFLHGGPGGGCGPSSRRFFDPARYRIVLFDQRGCGRSTPGGSLNANTTAHLINDIETLRLHLRIDKWLLLGGSWGATLALAYAEQYPERVLAMVLRGVFTARQSEIDWLYGRTGAAMLFPEAWARFAGFIPDAERADLLAAYHRRLTNNDTAREATAAREWCLWENTLATLLPSPLLLDETSLRTLARIETHYFVRHSFMADGQLIYNAARLKDIPGAIVQGRYDAIAPPITAWELCAAWPSATLTIVPDAGHVASEPGIAEALVAATDQFATTLNA